MAVVKISEFGIADLEVIEGIFPGADASANFSRADILSGSMQAMMLDKDVYNISGIDSERFYNFCRNMRLKPSEYKNGSFNLDKAVLKLPVLQFLREDLANAAKGGQGAAHQR